MYALLTTLIVSPTEAFVNVYLDSQATIHGFNKYMLLNQLSPRKFEKIPNYMTWRIIRFIIDHLSLQVSLHKIQAYTGNFYNEAADKLAKEGYSMSPLSLCLNNI